MTCILIMCSRWRKDPSVLQLDQLGTYFLQRMAEISWKCCSCIGASCFFDIREDSELCRARKWREESAGWGNKIFPTPLLQPFSRSFRHHRSSSVSQTSVIHEKVFDNYIICQSLSDVVLSLLRSSILNHWHLDQGALWLKVLRVCVQPSWSWSLQ